MGLPRTARLSKFPEIEASGAEMSLRLVELLYESFLLFIIFQEIGIVTCFIVTCYRLKSEIIINRRFMYLQVAVSSGCKPL